MVLNVECMLVEGVRDLFNAEAGSVGVQLFTGLLCGTSSITICDFHNLDTGYITAR